MTNSSMDDSAALSRRGLLIETVTASVARIITAPSVTEALPAVLATVADVVRIDGATIVEAVPGRGGPPELKLLFTWVSPDGAALLTDARRLNIDLDDPGLRAWLLPVSRGEAIVTTRSTANESVQRLLTALGVLTSLIVPVMVDGRHWGQISFDDCDREHDWAADDIKILTMLAEVVGAAITRERFLHQGQQREALLQAVNESAAQIISASDLRQAISRALAIVANALGIDRMELIEIDRSVAAAPRPMLRNAWHGPGVPTFESELLGRAQPLLDPEVAAFMAPLQSGSVVESHRSRAQGGVKELLIRFRAFSSLIVPIMVDGRYWGSISFVACKRERAWHLTEVDVLRILADLIGNAIARERYLGELAKANTIIQNSPTILYRLRGEPTFPMIYISQNAALLGHNPAELLSAPMLYRELIHPDDRDAVQAAMEQLLDKDAPPASIEFRMLTKAGGVRWVENRYTPARDDDGRLIEIEGILTDITARKAADEEIAKLARTDALTGLANRSTFSDRLRQAFAAAQRGAGPFAVLYLDLDQFKEVNDTLGHHTGDQLLCQVARRILQVTRECDIVARLGGDEFAILQAGAADSAAAGTLAEKVIQIVSMPYSIDGHELSIGVSAGISLYAADVDSPDALLVQADQALYRAKHAGRGLYRFHSDQIDVEARVHMALADDLRNALARRELELHYQPQVELSSGKIVGLEALMRWHHARRGLMLPADFLPIAEKFGLMQQLGRWALDHACRQISAWRAAGMLVPVVAINVALAQIKMGREFVRDVTESIARWGLSSGDIELNVTEAVLARSTLAQSHVLDELHQLGVAVAIDDFGSQYSSLNFLRANRVNRLKIARDLVAATDGAPGGNAMARAILGLAGELGVEVVAEGVDTEAQRALLLGASERVQGQGRYFSGAITATEAALMLQAGYVRIDSAHIRGFTASFSADS